jgi:HJR/Mrr/RecB family endonuclease
MPGRFPGGGPFGFRSDFNQMQRRPHLAAVAAFEERNNALLDTPSLLLQQVITPGDKTQEGQLVEAVTLPWFDIIEWLIRDPATAHQIAPRKWEEIIAGAYQRAGFDEVTLTAHSGDLGRDVIAVKRGIGNRARHRSGQGVRSQPPRQSR